MKKRNRKSYSYKSKGNKKRNTLFGFEKSQSWHLRRNTYYLNLGTSPKNNAFANYHADCYHIQKDTGRVLSKREKKKIFDDNCRSTGFDSSK